MTGRPYRGSAIVLLALLAGCASPAPPIFMRIDGQPTTGNPALTRQFEADKVVCQGEVAKADSGSGAPAARRQRAADDIFDGCMAQRGYVVAAPAEIEARRARAQ